MKHTDSRVRGGWTLRKSKAPRTNPDVVEDVSALLGGAGCFCGWPTQQDASTVEAVASLLPPLLKSSPQCRDGSLQERGGGGGDCTTPL